MIRIKKKYRYYSSMFPWMSVAGLKKGNILASETFYDTAIGDTKIDVYISFYIIEDSDNVKDVLEDVILNNDKNDMCVMGTTRSDELLSLLENYDEKTKNKISLYGTSDINVIMKIYETSTQYVDISNELVIEERNKKLKRILC